MSFRRVIFSMLGAGPRHEHFGGLAPDIARMGFRIFVFYFGGLGPDIARMSISQPPDRPGPLSAEGAIGELAGSVTLARSSRHMDIHRMAKANKGRW